MNLSLMIDRWTLARKNEFVTVGKHRIHDQIWTGVMLAPGAELVIEDVASIFELASWPEYVGWFAGTTQPGTAKLTLAFREKSTKQALSKVNLTIGQAFQPVRLTWPSAPIGPHQQVNLHLSRAPADVPEPPIFIGTNVPLGRDRILAQASGNGVEIGPGMNPQIFNKDGITVQYVEQMPAEKWRELYNKTNLYNVDSEIWRQYIIGDAHQIPTLDASIDFVFGSHVFEHLVNPIGHLVHWRNKLRSKGRVLCIVPDLRYTKDLRQSPCSMAEFLDEHAANSFEPTIKHYNRYAKGTTKGNPEKLMAERSSIHIHFYTPESIVPLLRYAVSDLGYESYAIFATPNNKDFQFVLTAR